MKAAVCERWGSVDGVVVRDVAEPTPGPGEVLLQVAATSLNGADAEMLLGRPLYSRVGRPRHRILGSDIAGTVAAIDAGVDGFAPGDEVIAEVFTRFGGLAERVCVPAQRLVPKPAPLSFELASALPQAGVLALQAVADHVPLRSGAEVLLRGGGGGVGVFALLLAKQRGAIVTAIDSASKLGALRALGADRALDHQTSDGLADGRRYDLIVDVVGRGAVGPFHRALTESGAYLVVGGSTPRLLRTHLYGALHKGGPTTALLLWDQRVERIEELAQLACAPGLEPVIGARYPLAEAATALAQLVERRAVGKVVVTVP